MRRRRIRARYVPLAPWLTFAVLAGCARDIVPVEDASTEPASRQPLVTTHEARPEAASPAEDAADSNEVPPIRSDGTIFGETEMMGTFVSITVWLGADVSARDAGAAIRDAFGEMARLETIASEWIESSDISRLNRNAGATVQEYPGELIELLARSREISAATDGAFDITFYAVGKLWSFRPGSVPPRRDEVARALPLVDWRGIEVDVEKNMARLARPGMAVGMGAIAKGYAVDLASRLLKARGLPNHIVEGGGDTYVSGDKGGKPWRVGVQSPAGKGTAGALTIRDRAVVTSGNYQRYFEYEGERYAHILDPKTGFPVPMSRSPQSVTIVASNAMDADAYCTAVAVMGTKKGRAFIESHANLEGIIIDAKGSIWISDGLKAIYSANP